VVSAFSCLWVSSIGVLTLHEIAAESRMAMHDSRRTVKAPSGQRRGPMRLLPATVTVEPIELASMGRWLERQGERGAVALSAEQAARIGGLLREAAYSLGLPRTIFEPGRER
jgi:hypothetical protein